MRAVDRRTLVDAADEFFRFRGPVLVDWAADDRVMPVEHAHALTAAFPDARTVLLDDCRTLVPLDQPVALARLIDAFLAGEPVGPTATAAHERRQTKRRWYASAGWWCIIVAVAHLAATGLFHGDSLRELLSGPVFGALDADPADPAARGAAFWYVAAGVALLGLGWGAQRAEAVGRPPGQEFAVTLTVLGAIGVIASPLSPFWIVLAIGLVAARKRPPTAAGTVLTIDNGKPAHET